MVLALVSRLRQRVELAVSGVVQKAIVIASAVVVLLFAAAFGLIAAYHALIDVARFNPIEAAGILGGSLLALGLLTLALQPLLTRRTSANNTIVAAPSEALALADKGLSRAAGQFGAFPLVTAAFIAGFLASRR